MRTEKTQKQQSTIWLHLACIQILAIQNRDHSGIEMRTMTVCILIVLSLIENVNKNEVIEN